MSRPEWESLCDGCGRCCLNKYEDEDGTISYTDVACRLFDAETCRCSNYKQRTKHVRDCVVLTPEVMPAMNCLPPTCAYRRIYEGKDLAWWHPLVSGDPETVHSAGISARGRVVSERGMNESEIERRIVRWPLSSRGVKRKLDRPKT